MKKIFYKLFIILTVFVLFSCGNLFKGADSEDENNGENGKSHTAITIPSEYWGTWIQMDTGDEYYIDNEKIYKKYYNYNSEVQVGTNGYTLESPEVLRKDTTVFFRKGGRKRSFKVTASGFSSGTNRSISLRAVGTGAQGISGRRDNEENAGDTETASSTDGETIEFEGGVADDPQTVTVTDGEHTGTATVDPQYEGANLGAIPFVEPGKYAFKTTYKATNADEPGFIYGNNLGLYDITFNITNIGYTTCETSIYSFSWEDTNLKAIDFEKEGNFASIAPDASKQVKGKFSYGYFDEEYKDVTIKITITDSSEDRNTWVDYVTLRFYRGFINFKVNARNFSTYSSAKLKGFLIYPDGRSERFTVSPDYTATISVPWSNNDYYFVFSGADHDTEMCYSFAADDYASPADLSGIWSIDEINAYEKNNKIQEATSVADFNAPIKAYLKNGDIDYYKFNISNLKCSKGQLEFLGELHSDITDISSEKNNGDGTINPGEIIWMDIAIQNTSGIEFSNVSGELQCDSQYITIIEGNPVDYGTIAAGKAKTNYIAKFYSGSGYSIISKDDYYLSKVHPFQFSVSNSCPTGTQIPLKIKMSEQSGNFWTNSFMISVERNGVILEYLGGDYGMKYTDKTDISEENNGNSKINPGETVWMDIAVKNSGTSLAQGVSLTIDSTSKYITFIGEKTASYGNIFQGYGKTFYNARNSSNTGYGSIDNTDYNFSREEYSPFKFTVLNTCPVNTEIPISILMKEQNGYTWTDSFILTVE